MGVAMRHLGFVLIPLRIPGLVSMEPFEKPWLASSQFRINCNRVFSLQVLFDGYLSQSFFVHWFTSRVGLMKSIIRPFQPQSKRCIGTKTTIKGKRCSGTFG